jgi:hypothetical protein
VKRPQPATVLATIALFVSLGGTGLAAQSYISGKRIQPYTLPANRLTPTAINSLRGQRGPAGPQGPPGPQGLPGPLASSNRHLVCVPSYISGSALPSYMKGAMFWSGVASSLCPNITGVSWSYEDVLTP